MSLQNNLMTHLGGQPSCSRHKRRSRSNFPLPHRHTRRTWNLRPADEMQVGVYACSGCQRDLRVRGRTDELEPFLLQLVNEDFEHFVRDRPGLLLLSFEVDSVQPCLI